MEDTKEWSSNLVIGRELGLNVLKEWSFNGLQEIMSIGFECIILNPQPW